MKTIVKVFIIFFLVLAIFGGAAWYAFNIYLKPKKIKRPLVVQKAAGPTRDDSAAAFERIVTDSKMKTRMETIAALQEFLTTHPSSPKSGDARKLLGNLNLEEFFSAVPGPGKTEYVVAPGDSLARIASKNKVSFDLIIRANNIDRLLIHPGDKFIIPTGDFSVEISGKEKTVTLRKEGAFFKEYSAISTALPSNPATGITVSEKIAWHDGKRVAFGDKNYVGSSRWISLSSGGLTLFSVVEDESLPDVDPPGSGVRMAPGDLEEIFALVNHGSPVSILP